MSDTRKTIYEKNGFQIISILDGRRFLVKKFDNRLKKWTLLKIFENDAEARAYICQVGKLLHQFTIE